MSYAGIENWLASIGVAWPRKDSGRLDLDSDAFRLMYHVPGIEKLHALRDSLGVIVKANLPIGRDGRNRTSLFPFGTATGRNAHRRSLYNTHAGVRSFMVLLRCHPPRRRFSRKSAAKKRRPRGQIPGTARRAAPLGAGIRSTRAELA
jgi:hypothetical protein